MLIERVAKNTGVILLGDIVNKASSIVTLYFFSRYLGAAGYGQFSFIFFYVGLFGSLTDLGIKSIMVRELSRPRSDKERILGNSILLTAAGSVGAVMAASLLPFALGYADNIKLLICIASFSLVFSFRDLTFRQLFDAVFQVPLKMQYPTLINAFNEIFVVGACLAVIYLKGSIYTLTLTYVLAYIPGFITVVCYSRSVLKPQYAISGIIAREILTLALPLGIAVALTSVYDKIGGVLVRVISGDEAVGYFSVAYRISISLKVIPIALMTSLFPLLSSRYVSDRAEFIKILSAAVKGVLLAAIPLAVGVTLFSRQIILIVSGSGFLPASPALVYVIWAAAILFVNIVFLYTFIAMDRQKTALAVSFLTLAANILLNLYCIPLWSYLGATRALLASETIGLVCGLLFIKKFVPEFRFDIFIKILAAGGAMALMVMVPVHPIIRFGAGFLVFCVVVITLKICTKEEFQLLRSFRKKP
jgi:O-antigen/teichoic acid export membrane protein